MFEFKHPNYYKNLEKIRKRARPAPDPIIITEEELKAVEEIDKQQASSVKPQAASNCRSGKVKHKHQASSSKAQASSAKRA
jgi:hypothetical protein